MGCMLEDGGEWNVGNLLLSSKSPSTLDSSWFLM